MTDDEMVAWLRELLDTGLGPDDRPWIEAIADRLEALATDSARLDKLQRLVDIHLQFVIDGTIPDDPAYPGYWSEDGDLTVHDSIRALLDATPEPAP